VLNQVTFDLGKLVEENINLIHLRAETKRVAIVSNIPNPTFLFGDRATINIVLRNLISNAMKFSGSNDSIFVSVQEEPHRVIISVKDTGVGMSLEQQRSLFDGSLNSTMAGTENEKGTGLGLVLSQELIQQQGGEMWVESTLGAGSIFFFSIPRPMQFM
jgi:two-component system, sensor histidine kinase and response regulator